MWFEKSLTEKARESNWNMGRNHRWLDHPHIPITEHPVGDLIAMTTGCSLDPPPANPAGAGQQRL